MRPKLLILVGPTCTGKTTWARKFMVNKQNVVRIAREEFALILRNSTFLTDKVKEQVECLYETGIISALSRGFDVIADSYNTSYAELEYYVDVFKPHADLYIKLFPGKMEDIAHSLRERFQQKRGEIISQQLVRNQVNDMHYLTNLLKKDMGPFIDWDEAGL